jgi:tetratricopeptide (TPR) repeat protein
LSLDPNFSKDSSLPSGRGDAGKSGTFQFPFSQSYQIREDEGFALQALFERVFYGAALTPKAIEALDRIRFQARPVDPKVTAHGLATESTRYIYLNRGETGIGKTRVFRQFRQFAAERRIPVYEIHCYDVEGIPFKPFLRVIQEILRDFEFGDALKEKYRTTLEDILPEIYRNVVESSEEIETSTNGDLKKNRGGSEEEMVRVFDALTQLLFEITALKPAVILVHDLHWGDRGTIELLRYIGRNLQLRNACIAATDFEKRRAGAIPHPHGPESADDTGEWREIVSREPILPGGTIEEHAALDLTEGQENLPVRLMILANYSGSSEEGHYLERAIRTLGEESFAFHGEIRTLTLEEAGRFIVRTLEGTDLPGGGPRASCDPEAFEKIWRICEGFPSYIHELFRLVFLSESVRPSARIIIDSALIEEVLGTGEPAPSATKGEEHPRTRILLRRLETASEEERRVMAVLALVRKPLTAEFLGRVLSIDDQSIESVETVLDRLEERAFIERVRHEFPRRGEEAGYYFRLVDYAAFAAENLDDEERKRIHHRIAEECRKLLAEEGDEKAYEIFHHQSRGNIPRSSVGFGILAARRFARSFSLEKAIQVCDEILAILPPPPEKGKKEKKDPAAADAAGDQDEVSFRLRRKVLDLQADLYLRLREFPKADAALDLLFKEWGDGATDEAKAILLLRQTEIALAARDPNRAIKTLSKAQRLVKEESPLAARLHLDLARAYLDRDVPKRAINFCLNGIKICHKFKEVEEYPDLYRVLARSHIVRGDSGHAGDNLQRAFDWLSDRGRRSDAAEVLDELGRVYFERGSYFRAARYLYRSLELKRSEGDILGLSQSYDELGRVYLLSDEIKAIEHLNRSLALKERVGDMPGLNPTLGILGGLYFRLGKFQRAIRYFKREIDNSQFLSDTRGLVDAFLHLAWVYLEVGELKQVENLSRQISILAGEFKLRAQQAEGARLQGIVEAMDRDWTNAEKHLRQAIELHAKVGDRPHEAEALFDLAEVKFTRELHDESLKLASKGQIIADALRAADLQIRAHVIKGNVHRFLKGGNVDRAKELLRKALEQAQPATGQSVKDVRRLFEIFYSLAKVYHYDREFAEAGNYYARAEAILRKVVEGLPEDMAARFYEDRRRKLFFEDAARFRKEVQSRTVSGTAIELQERPLAFDAKDKPIGLNDYKDLLPRLLRIHASIPELDYCDRLLAEGVDLVRAERGLVLRVQNRQYRLEATMGFGDPADADPDLPLARSLAEESVRKGRPIIYMGAEDDENLGKSPRLVAPARRAVLAVPILTEERIFGSLYLDRSISLGRFSPRDQVMTEALGVHGGCAFENRRRYELAVREPATGLYSPTYFIERLRDSLRWHRIHGGSFYLLGFCLPTLEGSIGFPGGPGEKLIGELNEAIPAGAAASWWNPVLVVLLFDTNHATAQEVQARTTERLGTILKDEVESILLAPESTFADGAAMYHELRRKLLPEDCDFQTLTELRRLLVRDIPLKEAKKILEKHIIESTLRKTGGNITHAAKELGLHRPQLSSLLKKHDLKREVYEREFDIRVNPLDN